MTDIIVTWSGEVNQRFKALVVACALASSLIPQTVLGGLFGPDNYDECVTESMKGVTSDLAAAAIIKSCREQFPDPRLAKTRNLTTDELAKLTGKAAPDWFRFEGYIYNGNVDLVIREFTVSLIPKGIEAPEARHYRVEQIILPLSKFRFSFSYVSVDGADGYSWSIVDAKGYPAKE